MDSPKFTDFVVTKATYKTVADHPISAYIFVPKTAPSGIKLPIIVRFHGGFLVTGSGIYDEWIPQWFLQYALLHHAIIVAPNYRLMPEASGLDILSDTRHFWTWLHSDLPSHLAAAPSSAIPDLDRVLAAGESAGGYLAVLSALAPGPVKIAAVVAAYPMLDVADPWYTVAGVKPMFGAPQIPPAVLAGHLASMGSGTDGGAGPAPVSEFAPPARLPLALSMVQQGTWTQFLGMDESLFPFRVLNKRDVVEGRVPWMFLYHGADDSAVPAAGTLRFAEVLKSKFGDAAVEVYTGPGDHGFDSGMTLETPWLKAGLEKTTSEWLS